MSDWPRRYHPIVDGVVEDRTVEVFAHEPGRTDALAAWADGEQVVVGGQPVVILPGTRRVRDRLVGLGDVAVADSSLYALRGDLLAAHLYPAGADEPPPVD